MTIIRDCYSKNSDDTTALVFIMIVTAVGFFTVVSMKEQLDNIESKLDDINEKLDIIMEPQEELEEFDQN